MRFVVQDKIVNCNFICFSDKRS